MKDIAKGTEKAVVLWLSGVRLADIRALPEVEALLSLGTLVKLDPLPITGVQAQHYQVLSGRQPGYFGFFDTLVLHGYAVAEEYNGRDAAPKLLPDILSAAGWTVRYKETSASELVPCIQAQSASDGTSCLIVKCAMSSVVGDAETSRIAEALRVARAWVGEAGLLALLSDTQPARVDRFVNVNNFLADMGVIERDAQSGLVDWSNSLAYYVGHGQLWVNRLGRDPQGAVHSQDEYEEVRDTLVKALPTKCRDAETGDSVIERVYRKEELYPGEYLFCAPDLVVLFKPGYAPSPHSTRLEFDEAVFTAPPTGTTVLAGVHPSQLTGFLLAAAHGLAPGASASEHAPLTAVAPTLLHALGVKHAAMDSSAARTLFLPSYLDAHPIYDDVQDQELSEEEEELVIARLRDLGYI